MRWLLVLTMALVAAPAIAAEPRPVAVDLSGEIDGRGLPMLESDRPIYHVYLTAKVDQKGEGDGTLALDPTPRVVDEFGFPTGTEPLPRVKLACSLKLIKTRKILMDDPATGIQRQEVEWRLFEVTGPQIRSRLSLATQAAGHWEYACLLVTDKDGKGRTPVTLLGPRPLPPCHPGCFPAGTPVRVPGGTRPIETLREGDVVTTVRPDGTPGRGVVASVFATKNRLVEVRAGDDILTTTETQPLALAEGGLRAAGDLKAGDRVHAWDGRRRRAVAVVSVESTGRESRVYNLVLDEPLLFVAGGLLARSKPPAPAADPLRP